jgi:hypothetical protein
LVYCMAELGGIAVLNANDVGCICKYVYLLTGNLVFVACLPR